MTSARPFAGHGPLIEDVTPGTPRMRDDVRRIIRTLRPDLAADAFDRFAAEAHGQGPVFTAAYLTDGPCVAVATHRTPATSRGRILLVEDLVTAAGRRSTRIRARLSTVPSAALTPRLCRRGTRLGRHQARPHRFYHVRRMRIADLHSRLDVPL